MNDSDRYDYEVRRQLWEEEQKWLADQKSQQEWILFLELINGQHEAMERRKTAS